MSPLNVGGNTSIHWEIKVNQGKAGKIKSTHPANHPPNGQGPFKNEGDAETDTSASEHIFTITIKHPKNDDEREDFKRELEQALANWNDGERKVTLKLPIEDTAHGGPNPNQIKVEWPDSDESGVVRGGGVGPTTA